MRYRDVVPPGIGPSCSSVYAPDGRLFAHYGFPLTGRPLLQPAGEPETTSTMPASCSSYAP